MKTNPTWKKTLEKIKAKVHPQTFETWFSQTTLVGIKKGVAKIGCKNQYVAGGLDTKYHNLVRNCLSKMVDEEVDVTFVIVPGLATQRRVPVETAAPLFDEPKELVKVSPQSAKACGLNPNYTFDRFVIGGSNRLARAAAMAVAETPGEAYNPLFLYGGVGLGKTHLLHAIGNYVLSHHTDLKVFYTPSEQMMNELILGIRNRSMQSFREKYRKLDVLILDDIQFISGKDAMQEEFFNTFNTLYQSGKQIVIASDRPPSEISKLEDRIRSRLEGGLVADISSPNFEMRMAILGERTDEAGQAIPEAVLMAIAEGAKHNIRELEGVLTALLAIDKTGEKISVETVKDILRKTKKEMRKKVKPEHVVSVVSEYFGVTEQDIYGRGRTADVAMARQIVMYLLRELMSMPLVKVAAVVKRSDHTTVLHAVKKIDGLLPKDEELRKKMEEIRLSLSQKATEAEREEDVKG